MAGKRAGKGELAGATGAGAGADDDVAGAATSCTEEAMGAAGSGSAEGSAGGVSGACMVAQTQVGIEMDASTRETRAPLPCFCPRWSLTPSNLSSTSVERYTVRKIMH